MRLGSLSCDAPPIGPRPLSSGRTVRSVAVAMGSALRSARWRGRHRQGTQLSRSRVGSSCSTPPQTLQRRSRGRTGPFPRPDVQGFDWTVPGTSSSRRRGLPVEGPRQRRGHRSRSRVHVADHRPARRPGAAWVIGACPDVTVTLLHTQKVVTIAVPTSRCFLNDWTTFIAALGAHVASASRSRQSRPPGSATRAR